MKTNDIFNFRRFGKYLASDAGSCAANYGLSMMLISLMGLIIYAGTIVMGLIFSGQWEGPGLGFRISTFAVSMFVMAVTMPVKCYGQITEKRFGTEWLMVPASGFEKFLSMIIMAVVVIPIISAGVYLGADALLCVIDKSCGTPIIKSFKELLDAFISFSFATEGDIQNFPSLANLVHQISRPWLYIDELIGVFLVFLLGAILFKTGKTAKTFLAIIALSAAASMISGPIVAAYFKDFAIQINALGVNAADSPELLDAMFNTPLFRNAALIDTISDSIYNIILLFCIYFRIKTLKH